MSGKKNRKHGGNKRSPSCQRYTAERRWEKNKILAIARGRKLEVKKRAHKRAYLDRKELAA